MHILQSLLSKAQSGKIWYKITLDLNNLGTMDLNICNHRS